MRTMVTMLIILFAMPVYSQDRAKISPVSKGKANRVISAPQKKATTSPGKAAANSQKVNRNKAAHKNSMQQRATPEKKVRGADQQRKNAVNRQAARQRQTAVNRQVEGRRKTNQDNMQPKK